ncbi:hypothetical protein ACROYT_G016460 [Oculina patagonica]
MSENLIFLKLLAALLHGITTAFHPVTENDHILVGHVFQQLYTREWLNCIQDCHDEPRCISYNYERSAGANGLCELNDCGVDDLCDRKKALIYSKGFVFQQIRQRKCYKTCKEIKHHDPAVMSGVYMIYPLSNAEPIKVYCELEIEGGGFAFLPASVTLRPDAQQIVNALFTDKKNVLLKLKKNVDRSESFTLIQPHPNFANTDFGVLVNSYTCYTEPQNDFMNEYILLGILPASLAGNNNIQGFKSNGVDIRFQNSDGNANSLFAFMPNYKNQVPSDYHPQLVYESRGVAVEWRKQAKPVNIMMPDRMMPNEFFFLTELHFGGGGCYTSSDRWNDGFNATAIGIR